jgi:hypothetical protein
MIRGLLIAAFLALGLAACANSTAVDGGAGSNGAGGGRVKVGWPF